MSDFETVPRGTLDELGRIVEERDARYALAKARGETE